MLSIGKNKRNEKGIKTEDAYQIKSNLSEYLSSNKSDHDQNSHMWIKYNKDLFLISTVEMLKAFLYFPIIYNKQGNQNTSFKQLTIAPEKKANSKLRNQ